MLTLIVQRVFVIFVSIIVFFPIKLKNRKPTREKVIGKKTRSYFIDIVNKIIIIQLQTNPSIPSIKFIVLIIPIKITKKSIFKIKNDEPILKIKKLSLSNIKKSDAMIAWKINLKLVDNPL